MKFVSRAAAIVGLAILLVVFAMAAQHAYYSWFGPPGIASAVSVSKGDVRPAHSVREIESSIVAAAEQASPAVVAISTTAHRTIESPFGRSPFGNDPFFRHFFGDDMFGPREQIMTGLGSGVIVDPSGIILTNNHVISGADQIVVALADGSELEVDIKGRDESSDIAVLQIRKKGEYPHVSLGNSDELEVGRIVLAIGTPFHKSLSRSVSMGIVSALGRSNLGRLPFGNLIQTDAAINQGNSGGPLINLEGEVVGINVAIITGSQLSSGNAGVGFAIPSNVARHALESIVKHGKVIRGYLGVTIQNIDKELAESLKLPTTLGALVSEVLEESPAGEAGIEPGDVIVRWNGREINSAGSLTSAVGITPVGETVEISYYRKGDLKTAKVKVAERPAGTPDIDEEKGDESGVSIKKLGLKVRAVEGDEARKLNLPATGAVVVTEVEKGSFAEQYDIRPGTGILEVNGLRVRTVAELEKTLEASGGSLRLLLRHGNRNRYIVVQIR